MRDQHACTTLSISLANLGAHTSYPLRGTPSLTGEVARSDLQECVEMQDKRKYMVFYTEGRQGAAILSRKNWPVY